MNLTQLVDRCETRYQDTNNHVFSAANWQAYVNDAYDEVLTAFSTWPWLEARSTLTVAASANSVSLPNDVWRVLGITNETNKLQMKPIDGRTTARDHFPDLSAEGTPEYYRIFGTDVEVFPTAQYSTALTVEYVLHPGALAANDEPIFPRPYHKILVDGALALAHQDDGHVEQAQLHQSRFDAGIQRLVEDLLSPRAENYPGIVDVY